MISLVVTFRAVLYITLKAFANFLIFTESKGNFMISFSTFFTITVSLILRKIRSIIWANSAVLNWAGFTDSMTSFPECIISRLTFVTNYVTFAFSAFRWADWIFIFFLGYTFTFSVFQFVSRWAFKAGLLIFGTLETIDIVTIRVNTNTLVQVKLFSALVTSIFVSLITNVAIRIFASRINTFSINI